MPEPRWDQVVDRIRALLNVPGCRDEAYVLAPMPEGVKEEVFKDQRGHCWICGVDTTAFVVHRIRPDGPPTRDNVVGLCSGCDWWFAWLKHCHAGYRKVPRFLGR